MQQITNAPRILTEMGWRAREVVVQHFDQHLQTRLLESFYGEAMALGNVAEKVKAEAVAAPVPQFAEAVAAN
jgi:hypothetical protein